MADHPAWQLAAFAGVFGAIFGSFLNVVAYRLPRHESLVSPASHCPSCGTPVKPYDNIPILSWLLLRGHCRSCGEPISPRYPLVEALTAALCVGAVLAHQTATGIALSIALILIVVPAALIDLEHRIIPNRLTALGAVARDRPRHRARPGRRARTPDRGRAAGGFLLLAALAYPGGMGMGDVKLAGVMGLFLGAAVAPAILIALLAGVLVGAVIIARKGAQRGTQDRRPVRPVPGAGGDCRRLRRAAAGRPLHQSLPALKRGRPGADRTRAGGATRQSGRRSRHALDIPCPPLSKPNRSKLSRPLAAT